MKVKVNNSIPQTSFTGIYNSKMLKKGLEFAAKNSSLFTATVSLGFSTAARPAAILLTPDTDKENKKYACAKSLSSSAAGYLLMLLGSVPVAKAVENAIKEMDPGREVLTARAEGLPECRKMLQLAKAGKYNGYLLEGMACPGGCVAGAGTIANVKKSSVAVTQMAQKSEDQNVLSSKFKEYLHILEEK